MAIKKAYALWLNELFYLKVPLRRELSKHFNGAINVFHANREALLSSQLLTPMEVEMIMQSKVNSTCSPEDAYENLLKQSIQFVSIEDSDYPQKLREIIDHPYGLYYKGTLPPSEHKSASIVGARQCSAYGHSSAREIGYLMARSGYTVISGMARGIDAAGQTGCLEAGGFTCAVLGSGVDICYPPENKKLYDRILEKGCILSEFAPGTPPLSKHFPMRNRIISGLSDHVIVVEARIRSGSLITAQMACQQNRNLLVVPGRINDPMSQGTNHLIEMGAQIIPSEERLLEKLSEEAGMPLQLSPSKKPTLNKNEKSLLQIMDYYAKSAEDLMLLAGFSYREFLETIYTLSQKGLIRESARMHYSKV